MPTMPSSLPHRAHKPSMRDISHTQHTLHSAHDFGIEAAPSADFLLFPDKTATMLSSWAPPYPTMPSNGRELVHQPRNLPRGVEGVAMPPGRTTSPKGYAPSPDSRQAGTKLTAASHRRGRSTGSLLGHAKHVSKPKGINAVRGNEPGHVMSSRPSSRQGWHLPTLDPPLAAPHDVESGYAPVRSLSGSQSPSSQIGHAEPGYWVFSSTQAATNQSHDDSDNDPSRSPPPAPRIERLPTPDLPPAEALSFCNCCATADAGHHEACALVRNRKLQRNFDLLGVGSMFD